MAPKNVLKLESEAPETETDSVLRQAIDSMNGGFAYFGPDDRLVFCNQAYLRFHPLGKDFIRPGVLFEDIIKTGVQRGLVEDAKGREKAYARERMELHRNPNGPIYRRMADGSTFILNESRTPDGGTILTTNEVSQLTQAEEELRASEALLLRMLDASPVSVQITTRDGEHLYDNKRALEILGYTAEELSSINAASYYADPSLRKKMKDALYKTGETPPTEVELVKPDGSHYFVIMTSVLLDFGGKKAHLTYQYDITEHRKLEKQIEAERARYLDALESIEGGVALFDADDKFVLCNSTYRQTFKEAEKYLTPGQPYEKILRAYAAKGLNTEARENPKKYIRERLARHKKLEPSTVQMVKTGKWFLLREYRTSDGGTLITRTDVTERMEAENALRESEQRLRTIIDTVPAMISVRDENSRYLMTNRFHQEFTGAAEKEIAGKTPSVFSRKHGNMVKKLEREVVKQGKTISSYDYSLSDAQGRPRVLMISKAPLRDLSDRTVGTVTTGIDITERKEFEEQAKADHARLRDALESVADGVALFDAKDRLVLFNAPYYESLEDLHDLLVPGAYFKDIVRASYERTRAKGASKKEIDSYVRRRMARHKKHESTVHYYPETDTSVMLQEYETSDGGTFVIRTDITDLKRAEKALRESGERHRDLIQGSVMGIVIDRKGKPLFANQAYADLFGFETPEAILALKKLDGLYASHDLKKIKKHRINRLAGKEAPDFYEFEGIKKDGSRIHLESRFRLINWQGQPAIQSTVIDITERRHLENLARAEHERLMDAIESIADGVVLLDKDDRFVLCNTAYRRYLEKIDDLLVPGTKFENMFRAATERNIIANNGRDIEEIIRQRMKSHRKREAIIQRYADSDNWFIVTEYKTSDGGTFIVRTDITESKKAEDALRMSASALRDSEARLLDIAESASDHFWETGPEHRYSFVSEKFLEEANIPLEEVVGKTRMEFVGPEVIAQNPKRWKAHADDLKNHRPFRNFEYSKKMPNGRVLRLSVSGRPYFDEEGNFLGYRGASADITEYRRTERELTQHNKMESLGYLAGGIAHNLNNMLQPILILGQMTRDGLPEGSSEQQNLDIICQAGQNATELVERIAQFSRQKGLDRESADIFKVIRQGLDFLRPIIPKFVTVHENLDKKTGTAYVDAVQVQTVLMNLAANAVDAMGKDKGELRISLSKSFVDETAANSIPGLSRGNYAKLTVADTGHGMDEETLSRIFDPFYTTKDLDKGTGLGLSSAFGTIYKHRGTIRAASTQGIGTVFDVYLPLENKV